ncbi:hypothetical protein, partial [Phaeodactylibacter xiamenensis]|uniref:hypothetical protein n=1 Tax=Phaeodactylibacter xiamenensis TaxID=1524460 RepID=UPI0024A7EDD8
KSSKIWKYCGGGKFDHRSNIKAHNKTGIGFFAVLVLLAARSVVRALRSFRLIAPGFFKFCMGTGYEFSVQNRSYAD